MYVLTQSNVTCQRTLRAGVAPGPTFLLGYNLIVTNLEQCKEVLKWLEQQEIVAYDIETTGLNTRKDTIIGFGISNESIGYYIPIYKYNTQQKRLLAYGPGTDMVQIILQMLSKKKPITWNASFDLRFTKINLGIDLLPALHADVLLMKHTCDEEFPFGLKEVAAKHWGIDVKKEKEEMQDSIKQNGGTSKEFYKAETEILGKYCIKDCTLTYALYKKYSKELKDSGLESFYYQDEVLPLYKEVTIPMEEIGVKLDISLIQKTQKEILLDIAKIEKEIQNSISPLLEDIFVPWFLNKDYPTATYTGKIPAWAKHYNSQREAWLADVTSSNPEGPNYMFNLLSKHHLKKLFFDTLKEVPLSKTPPSKTFPDGQPQVDEEFLNLAGQKYIWAKQLIVYNKLIKLKGTYVERFLEEQEDGRFYPSFQQHRTVSGRYSGDLQQLPRPIDGKPGDWVADYTNRIRAFFISDNDSVLMSADYEQLEPRVFCHISGDEALRKIFLENKDFYSEMSRMVEGTEEVSKAQRQKAKTYGLGIPYGMTGYKLKFEIGCEQEEADWLVRKYLTAFPQLEEWMNASKNKAISKGRITSQCGRVRHLSIAKDLYNKYGPPICDDLQLWKALNTFPGLYTQARSARKVFKNALNNAINFQIQSMGASIINRASIAIVRIIKDQNLSAKIVMQVHDELVLHVPISEQSIVSSIVKEAMEGIVKLSVPLKTTPKFATNYKDCK